MVSWETLSTSPKRTNRSLSNRRLHTLLPSGGALHASAIKCASASPSKACGYSRSGFFRDSVACNPLSTKLLRTFITVTGVTLYAAQICSYFHIGPAWLLSDFSKMCARVTVRAGAIPEEVSFSRCCRSSFVNSTIYFLFMILAFLLWFPTQIASLVPLIIFSFDNLLDSFTDSAHLLFIRAIIASAPGLGSWP